MKKSLAALVYAILAMTATAEAAPPLLASYVTDDGKDVYVALYDDVGVELSGCSTQAAARALLALPPSGAIEKSTLAKLKASHELMQPPIPCPPAVKFDADLPENTAVWFDLAGTRRFYLQLSGSPGLFYSIPGQCTTISAAFDMTRRIAKPGVLQASTPPLAMTREIVLDCGDAALVPDEPDGGMDVTARWSLHTTEAAVAGDEIYVAVYEHSNNATAEKGYLPIYRINGSAAGDAAWAGTSQRARVEAALKALFGIEAEQSIKTLAAADVTKLVTAPFLDLCLTSCDGYPHEHAFFAKPAEEFELVKLPPPVATRRFGILGETILRWVFAPDRAANFVKCDRLVSAMGMTMEGSPGGEREATDEASVSDGVATTASFGCPLDRSEVCVRSVPENGILAQTMLAKGNCPRASHLRIELPAKVRLTDTLLVEGTDFASIEIAPRDPGGRSELVGPALPKPESSPPCVLDPFPTMIVVRGPVRLRINRVDLVRPESNNPGQVVGLLGETADIGLDHVSIGASGDGRRPIERALRLCRTSLHAFGGRFEGSQNGLHALRSKVTITGTEAEPAAVSSNSVGLSMFTDGTFNLKWLTVRAARAIHLRGSKLKGKRVTLEANGTPASASLQLEGEATGELHESSITGFACVGRVEAGTEATLILSINDLLASNTAVSCGPGSMKVIP